MQMPKYELGQKVLLIADTREPKQVREVLNIQMNSTGITYQITSKEVDIQKVEVINGFMIVGEDELEAYVEKIEE